MDHRIPSATVVASFIDIADAQSALTRLEGSGIRHADARLVEFEALGDEIGAWEVPTDTGLEVSGGVIAPHESVLTFLKRLIGLDTDAADWKGDFRMDSEAYRYFAALAARQCPVLIVRGVAEPAGAIAFLRTAGADVDERAGAWFDQCAQAHGSAAGIGASALTSSTGPGLTPHP